MVNIEKVRELYIASDKFDTFNKSSLKKLSYEKWEKYIDNHNQFVWYDDTKEAKEALQNIEKIPKDFQQSFLNSFGKTRCYKDYDIKKNIYNISIAFYEELKRVTICFENKPKIAELKLFLEMANYLGALLLIDGTEIIDDNVIKALEQEK
ncbi:MAG: hypothetical protein LBE34_14250 [Flavobacteriaceae bacterium]|jgi:hypothetical protein|nr:hypothetical protein [Flavobacteriaceae bacterium]